MMDINQLQVMGWSSKWSPSKKSRNSLSGTLALPYVAGLVVASWKLQACGDRTWTKPAGDSDRFIKPTSWNHWTLKTLSHWMKFQACWILVGKTPECSTRKNEGIHNVNPWSQHGRWGKPAIHVFMFYLSFFGVYMVGIWYSISWQHWMRSSTQKWDHAVCKGLKWVILNHSISEWKSHGGGPSWRTMRAFRGKFRHNDDVFLGQWFVDHFQIPNPFKI